MFEYIGKCNLYKVPYIVSLQMEWSAHRSAAALVSPRSCSGSAATNRAFRGGSGSYRDPEEQRGAPPQSKTNASALLWVNLCKPAHQVRLITETSIQFDWLMSLLFPDVYRKKRKRSNYGTNLSYFRCKANKTQSSHAAKVWISPSGLYRFTSGLSHWNCFFFFSTDAWNGTFWNHGATP